MEHSRSVNGIFNMMSGSLYKIVVILLSFVQRTVFIYVLGEDYLGLNGLFTSVLNALSLAELGVGQAIVFHLYKPIAENDIEKIKSIMQFYKKTYLVIGCAVFSMGILLMPFLKYLVNFDSVLPVNLYAVYLLYLANSAVSYIFFAYMQNLLNAMQKSYIINRINIEFLFITTGACCFILIAYHNYILYLIARIGFGILNNFMIRYKAVRMYPYLKEKNVDKIDKKKKKAIFLDVSSIFVFRVSSTISNSVDNIVISVMLGTVYVGYNSNYEWLTTGIIGIVSMMIYSFSAGIGNLNASESLEKKVRVFREIELLNYIIATVAFCGVACLSNDFIELWTSDIRYVYPMEAVWFKAFFMFMGIMLTTHFSFREAMGLFRYGKYRQLMAGLANIFLSIIFVKLRGITGVFAASVISSMLFAQFAFPKIIFKYGFQMNYRKEQLKILFRLGMAVLIGLLDYIILTPLRNRLNLLYFIAEIIITVFFSLVCLAVIYWRTEEFRSLLQRGLSFFKK